jgi:hypothetical protein
VELQPQRCGPKINSYDRSLTAQRPGAVVLPLFQHAGEIHGWMQGRPGERAAETRRVVCSLALSPRPAEPPGTYCLTTDARPEHGPLLPNPPERGSLQGLLGASCHVIDPGLAFPGPSPDGCPRRSGCHGPQTKPKPAPMASIQYKNGHCGTASPVVLNARTPERQNVRTPPGITQTGS